MTKVLKLLKFKEELDPKFTFKESTELDMIGKSTEFDIKFLKLFHENFIKEFQWRVPGTQVGDKHLEIPVADLPAYFTYKISHI